MFLRCKNQNMPLQYNYFVESPVYSCDDVDSHSQEFLLPEIVDCSDESGTILEKCGEGWNDTLGKCDTCYYIPFLSSDKVQIQSTFFDEYNADPTNPVNGFGTFVKAEIYGCDGVIVSDDYTTFSSRAMVAYSGSHSYQIIELDMALVPDQFYIKLIAYDTAGNVTDEKCSQEFGKVTCDESTILIKSEYSSFDTQKVNYYGAPDSFVGDNIQGFDNSLRIRGFIRPSELSIEKTVFNRAVKQTTITEQTTCVMTKLIPPYMNQYLMKTLIGGEVTYFNGIEGVVTEAAISLTDFNNMFFGTWQFGSKDDLDVDHSCS